MLYYASTYADTHCIETFVLQNNSSVYINLTIQFSCSSRWQFSFSSTSRQIFCRAKPFKLLYNEIYRISMDR